MVGELAYRRGGALAILVQRVRGGPATEAELRTKLFHLLTDCGLRVTPAVLKNMETTLPALR